MKDTDSMSHFILYKFTLTLIFCIPAKLNFGNNKV